MASKNMRQGKTLSASAAGAATARTDVVEAVDAPASGELDRFHVAILAELQREARLSNAELAARIGLSAAPTWRRVRWLEEQGFITGYRAEIDRRRIGLGVLAFVRVDADRNNGAATKQLEEAIRLLPEVIACHYISGAGTFELEVMATDLDAFSRFSIDTLLNLPNVKDIHTSFSLGEVKAGGALPLGHLKPKG
ncbi:Lrp/AsnC family transcriptional regulator [Roseateles amylovorans]|uniref:Lrp/AsnC family transcriptional regulator n=1 Tax=Roseateles amylovorans TaxID=2978473 RepID=A0ABY6B101_9BURK|nr:Lrp/AsnC family transcriptional regulator [Roseateles amylovorans]UXH78862.1 Lrp/AsnC family transcriptional regulator [Roseateles amylovorans]